MRQNADDSTLFTEIKDEWLGSRYSNEFIFTEIVQICTLKEYFLVCNPANNDLKRQDVCGKELIIKISAFF